MFISSRNWLLWRQTLITFDSLRPIVSPSVPLKWANRCRSLLNIWLLIFWLVPASTLAKLESQKSSLWVPIQFLKSKYELYCAAIYTFILERLILSFFSLQTGKLFLPSWKNLNHFQASVSSVEIRFNQISLFVESPIFRETVSHHKS